MRRERSSQLPGRAVTDTRLRGRTEHSSVKLLSNRDAGGEWKGKYVFPLNVQVALLDIISQGKSSLFQAGGEMAALSKTK